MNRKLFFLFLFIPCLLKAASTAYDDPNNMMSLLDMLLYNDPCLNLPGVESKNAVPQIEPIQLSEDEKKRFHKDKTTKAGYMQTGDDGIERFHFESPRDRSKYAALQATPVQTIDEEVERFYFDVPKEAKLLKEKIQTKIEKQKASSSFAQKTSPKKKRKQNSRKTTYLTCPFPGCNIQYTKIKNIPLFDHLKSQHGLASLLNNNSNDTTISMDHGAMICVTCSYAAKCKSTFYAHQNSAKHLFNNK